MNVLIMISDGYPKNFSANNSKGEFIAMGIQAAGGTVTMVDLPFGTKGIYKREDGISSNGLKYTILPRQGKYFAFFHNIPAIWDVLKKNKDKEKNHLILGLTIYPVFLIIVLMAKCQGYQCSTLFHEWHISLKHPHILSKIEAYIKDATFGYILDAIFPISHFLEHKSYRFKKPTFIIPVLGSYNRMPAKNRLNNHFTFCGHATYLIRNTLILDAFKMIIDSYRDAKLYLVLIGNKPHFDEVNKILNKMNLDENVEIMTQLPQEKLYHIYDTSLGLLIPLDPNNLQDKARFSQKIAEYAASKRPIITSEAGEIPYYFKHEINALIEPYTAEGYYEGMKKLIEDRKLADQIGLNGYEVGNRCFNFQTIGANILQFIRNLPR